MSELAAVFVFIGAAFAGAVVALRRLDLIG